MIKIPNSFGEEVGLELKGMTDVPTECTRNFSVDFVWKPTSFDRMLSSLKVRLNRVFLPQFGFINCKNLESKNQNFAILQLVQLLNIQATGVYI